MSNQYVEAVDLLSDPALLVVICMIRDFEPIKPSNLADLKDEEELKETTVPEVITRLIEDTLILAVNGHFQVTEKGELYLRYVHLNKIRSSESQ